jgi:hypothetical protein
MYMLRSLVLTVIGLVWTVVLVLVGARFLALLFNANRDAAIVDALYRWSEFLVRPFFGMLNLTNEAVEGTGGVFEPASLIAFVVYFILGLIVLALVSAPFAYIGRGHTHAPDDPTYQH